MKDNTKTEGQDNRAFPRVWTFDVNRRKYTENRSAPIRRYHWREEEIVSETSRSWVTRWGKKIPKNSGLESHPPVCFSEEDIDKDVYVHDNRHKISKSVNKCGYDKLKEIAAILNYTESS